MIRPHRVKYGIYTALYTVSGLLVSFKLYTKFNRVPILLMEGKLGWYGCWKGKILFGDSAFPAEELMNMAKLYEERIGPHCKELIRENNPDFFID